MGQRLRVAMAKGDRAGVNSNQFLRHGTNVTGQLLTASRYTHTHPFNGPFSGTNWVSRYQKGNTNLDFCEARDSEWQWHQLGCVHVCT